MIPAERIYERFSQYRRIVLIANNRRKIIKSGIENKLARYSDSERREMSGPRFILHHPRKLERKCDERDPRARARERHIVKSFRRTIALGDSIAPHSRERCLGANFHVRGLIQDTSGDPPSDPCGGRRQFQFRDANPIM